MKTKIFNWATDIQKISNNHSFIKTFKLQVRFGFKNNKESQIQIWENQSHIKKTKLNKSEKKTKRFSSMDSHFAVVLFVAFLFSCDNYSGIDM